jgi:DNA topoisomerase-2
MKISKFYQDEYSASAFYQSYRTIGHAIDGLKNGARKIVHVIDKNNITTEIKNSSLAAKVVESEAYLHGQVSLEGTIVTLAQNFPGTNNFNLLKPEGNFGNRFIHEASASRYIFTRKSEWFDKFFKKEDYPILIPQSFEGEKIEPRFYVPILPIILLNGSEGVGNGFAQKILPRKIEDIISAIKSIQSGKKVKRLLPFIKGFNGKIFFGEEPNKILISGVIEIKNLNTIIIREIPFQYDLDSYLKVLNTLIDKKIIKDYTDKSDNDKFLFELDVARDFTKLGEEQILEELKLVKRYTENFTCIDEENKIIEFENELDLLEKFISIRMDYYEKRKKHMLSILQQEADVLSNKVKFILAIIDEELKINNILKSKIEKDMKNLEFFLVEDSYDYLLRMPIWSLTKEKVEELKSKLKDVKENISILKKKTPQILWEEDLVLVI